MKAFATLNAHDLHLDVDLGAWESESQAQSLWMESMTDLDPLSFPLFLL